MGTKSRRRKMLRLQEKMRKEEARRKVSNRRLAPDHIQRLKALKMEGEATFVHPSTMPKDSPNYRRWAEENCSCPCHNCASAGEEDFLDPGCPVHNEEERE
jgi:hypothetical protein